MREARHKFLNSGEANYEFDEMRAERMRICDFEIDIVKNIPYIQYKTI